MVGIRLGANGGFLRGAGGGFLSTEPAPVAPVAAEFTTKPDYSYSTTDFPNDPTDEVTVAWRDFDSPGSAGPDASDVVIDTGSSGLGVWAVTASNISGVNTYPTYAAQNTLDTIIELCAANSSKFIIKISGVAGYQISQRFTPALGAQHCILWFLADGGNDATTWLTRDVIAGILFANSNFTSDDGVLEVRNANCGLTPRQYDDVYGSSRAGVFAISGITQANPPVVTATGHTIANDTEIILNSVVGMIEVNRRTFTVKNVTANTLELYDSSGTPAAVDGTGFTAYSSNGVVSENIDLVAGGDTTGSTSYSGEGNARVVGLENVVKNSAAGGSLTVRNGQLRGARGNMISATIADAKDDNSLNSQIWLYDSILSDGGQSTGAEHMIYVHSLREFRVVRCALSNSATHIVKANGHTNILIDNWIIDDNPDLSDVQRTPGDAALLNMDGWQDLFYKRNIVEVTSNLSSRRTGITTQSRTNAIGGVSRKIPFPMDPDDVSFGSYRSSDIGSWDNASSRPDHGSSQTDQSETAGSTHIGYKAAKVDLATINAADNMATTSADFYRIYLQIKITSTGVYETHESLATSDGVDTLTLATAIPTGREVENDAPFKFIPDGNALDLPNLNSKLYNPNDADYYFGSGTNGINDGSDNLDRTKTTLYHYHVVEDSSFVLLAGSAIDFDIFKADGVGWRAYVRDTNVKGSLPPSPLNKPTGATGAWPDNASYGEWDSQPGEAGSFGSALPTSGVQDHGSDVLFPQAQYFKNITYTADAGSFRSMWNDVDGGGTRSSRNLFYETDGSFVNAAGVVTDLGAAGTPRFDTLNRADTTLASGASVDATSVVVASATGVSAGMTVNVHVDGDFGATSRRLFSTKVSSGYTSGTTIPLDDALPKAAASGNKVEFVDAAGTPPSWFPDESDIHPTEEHI